MARIRQLFARLLLLVPLATGFAGNAAAAEKRIALVIGNAGYQAGVSPILPFATTHPTKGRAVSRWTPLQNRADPTAQSTRRAAT